MVVVFVVLGIASVGLVIFGPRPAKGTQREERAERYPEDDVIPILGHEIMGVDLTEADSFVDRNGEFTELSEDWDHDNESMDT